MSTNDPPSTTEFIHAVVKGSKINITDFNVAVKNFLNTRIKYDLTSFDNNEIIETIYSHHGTFVDELVAKHLEHPILKSLTTKSAILSDKFRSIGNERYKTSRLHEALRCYTIAIAFAPLTSNCLALGYSNRSACFFELKDKLSCLRDIERFEKSYDTPHDSVYNKVITRKTKCMELKPQDEYSPKLTNFCSRYFKLSSVNELVPSADARIGIRVCDERGRHVVNTSEHTIPPGEVIMIEKPFSAVLLNAYSFEYKHCTGCFKDLNHTGVPCSCVFAMYCSESCATSNRHSNIECSLSSYLYEINMDRTIHLSLSTILKLDNLESLLDSLDPSAFDSTRPYNSSDYATIHGLIYHKSNLTNKELRTYGIVSLIITTVLKTHYTESELKVIRNLLFLHQMSFPCNAHSLYKLADFPVTPTESDIRESNYAEFGAGAFPLLSLLNHACNPNVTRITLRYGVTAVISVHSIPPGAEITDNYGYHFATTPKQKRVDELQRLYGFVCKCQACSSDSYALIQQLQQHESFSSISCDCGYTLSSNMKCRFCDKFDHHEYESMLETLTSANSFLLSNQPIHAFNDAVLSLRYFEARTTQPNVQVCTVQEIMKVSLFIASNDLFRNECL